MKPAPYQSDSESDGEDAGAAEPPAKIPREIHALGVAGATGALPDQTAVETPQKELRQLLASAEVRRLLKDFEEGADLELPADINRQKPHAASQWSSDCAEVYSPNRITAAASRMGLKPAWAPDLITFDETGSPWDFRQAAQRKS